MEKKDQIFPFCVQAYVSFWESLCLILLSDDLDSHSWSNDKNKGGL